MAAAACCGVIGGGEVVEECCLCCFGVGSVGGGSGLLRRGLLSGCVLSQISGRRLTLGGIGWRGSDGILRGLFLAGVRAGAVVGGLDGFTGGKAENCWAGAGAGGEVAGGGCKCEGKAAVGCVRGG